MCGVFWRAVWQCLVGGGVFGSVFGVWHDAYGCVLRVSCILIENEISLNYDDCIAV
jgi:hypothetical protein